MNPSAREVLEAELTRAMKKRDGSLHDWDETLWDHYIEGLQFAWKLLELAERADLERVEATLELMEAEEERLNANYGGRYDCPHPEPCNTFYRAITIVRAAFPEVKEGE